MNLKDLTPEAIDCHVHAGLERSQTLEAMLRYCRNDGREIIGLLDHAELYMEHPPDWAEIGLEYAARRIAAIHELADMIDLYRNRLKGPAGFYRQAREGIRLHGSGMRAAVGIEISGASLEAGLVPPGWLDGADFIGICTTQPREGHPWGEHLAELIALADTLRGGREMGLVLHHPFRWRLFEMVREMAADPSAARRGQRRGPDFAAMSEAAGFSEEDARVTVRALADAGATPEVNFASFYAGYIQQQVGSAERTKDVLAAARGAFARLREAGVNFSLGSDMHAVPKSLGVYRPSDVFDMLGLTMEDVELPFALRER